MGWQLEKEEMGKKLVNNLFKIGAIKTWLRDNPNGWKLHSGIWSPFYIQIRPLCSYHNSKELLTEIGSYIGKLIEKETKGVNKLLGIAYAGIPLAVSATIVSGIPSCYTRKIDQLPHNTYLNNLSNYGEHSLIEGDIQSGDNFAILDDVVTNFDSKILTQSLLKIECERRGIKGKINADEVIVLVDREQGAQEKANNIGVNLHSLIPFNSKGIDWLKESLLNEEYRVIKNYLRNPQEFQNDKIQRDLRELSYDLSKVK